MTTDQPGTISDKGGGTGDRRALRGAAGGSDSSMSKPRTEDVIAELPPPPKEIESDTRISGPARSGMDRLIPWLALAGGLTLTVSAALWVHRSSLEEEKMRFQAQAEGQIQRLKRELDVALESVRPLALLFASSDRVEREEFRRFATEILGRQSALESLAWLPRITREGRARFERSQRADGLPTFSIIESDANDNYVSAAERDEYFPIEYIEPWQSNQKVVGADLGVNQHPATALARALHSNDVTVTYPIHLPWIEGRPRGVLVFVKVGGTKAVPTAQSVNQHAAGLVMGVFNLNGLVSQSFPDGTAANLRLTVNDIAVPQLADPGVLPTPAGEHAARRGALSRMEMLDVGGRTWVITVTEAGMNQRLGFGRTAWGVLAGGIAGSMLLTGFLFSRIGRSQAHQQLRERTHDLREANRTLLESRQRVQSIFDATIDPLWDWDVVANTSVISPSWKRLLGYASDEEITEGTTWASRVHPDDYPVAMSLLNRCVSGETELYEAEYRLWNKAGEWIRVLSRGHVVKRDADGLALRMIGNMTDISSIVEAKEALAASQERFEQIADNIDQVFWMLSLEPLRMLYISPGFERIWGRPASALCEDRTLWLQTIHPDDRSVAEQACDQWLATGATGSYEIVYRIIRPDGGVRWIHDRGSSVRDARGNVFRVVGVAADVTSRIKTEAALAESEALRRAMIEQAAMGILQIELCGRFAIANKRACEILGYDESDLLRINARDVTHPDDLPENLRLLNLLLNGEIPSFTQEKRYIGGKGRKVIWANVAVSLVRDETGNPKYFISVVEDISQRKLSELALRESEATNRALLEAVPDHLFRMDRQGRYLAYHTADESRLAARPAEFIGRTVSDVLPPERAGSCMRALEKLFETGEPQTYEYAFDVSAVARRHYEVRVVKCGQDEALLLVRDVSAHKLAEESLRVSEERLRILIENAPAGVAMLDRDLRYLAYSRRWLTDYGLEGQNILGKSHYEVFPDIPERWKKIHARCLTGVSEKCEEDTFERSCGAVEHLRWEIQPWKDASGGVGGLVFFTETITARKRAELSLAESESRLEQTFVASPIGMALVTLDSRFMKLNRAFCDMLGWSEAELLSLSVQAVIHPEARADELVLVQEIISGVRQTYQLENRYLHKDGHQVWAQLNVSMVRDAGGVPLHFVFQIQDITQRKQAEQRQRLMVAELDHRVKNNLAAVLSLAEQSMRTTTGTQEFYNVFVNRVRALARLHGALAHSHWQHINLRSIVEQTLAAFHSNDNSEVIIEGKDIVLPGRIGSPLALTLHELATNAVKHGSLSTLHGSLKISWDVVEERGQSKLRMMWKESGGPAVVTPTRRGLGRDLIEGGLAHELGGMVRLLFQPEGVVCEISVPIPADGA